MKWLVSITWFISTAILASQITINSDSCVIDHNQMKVVYKDNVKMKKEEQSLICDELRIFYNNKVDKLQAYGSPAIIEENTGNDGIGTANLIEYEVMSDQVYLIGNATIINDENKLMGPKLRYDLKNKTLNAKSSKEERVKFIYKKNNKDKA